jgi:Flp pilus assembly protein TadG
MNTEHRRVNRAKSSRVTFARRHRRHGAGAKRQGAVLIEFALILPVLITIVLAAIDFGRFAHAHMAVTNAARVGAGYASMHPYTSGTQALWQSKVRESIKNEMQGVLNYNDTQLVMTTPQVITDADGLKRVRIEVKYPFTTLVNWSLIPNNYLMTRAVEMRFIRQ